MEHDFWEHGNSVKVNFGEQLNLFLMNKGTTVNFYWKKGNMHPPSLLWEAVVSWWYYTLVIDLIGQLRLLVVCQKNSILIKTHTHTKNYREKWLKYGNSWPGKSKKAKILRLATTLTRSEFDFRVTSPISHYGDSKQKKKNNSVSPRPWKKSLNLNCCFWFRNF